MLLAVNKTVILRYQLNVIKFIVFLIYFTIIYAKLDTTWWRHTNIYELVVPTFKDSNNDGIGDIKGISLKLNHFMDLGIETLYLRSFYNKIKKNNYHSVVDDFNIDPIYGTMEDFEKLMKQIKKNEMKLVMDLVTDDIGGNRDISKIKECIQFWFDKGVNGFRLDYRTFRFRSSSYLKEKVESFYYIKGIKNIIDEYNKEFGGSERIFIYNGYSFQSAIDCFGRENYPLYHFQLTYNFRRSHEELSASDYSDIINAELSCLPKGNITGWMTEDFYSTRIGTKMKPEYVDIFMITTSMLPGAVQYYYGAEISLMNGIVTHKSYQPSILGNMKPNALLMQWDDSLNSGFSPNLKTLIPTASDYRRRNVQEQKKTEKSHYNLMKNLNNLRKTKTIRDGKFHSQVYSSHVYVFWRQFWGYPAILVVVNLNDIEEEIDLKRIFTNLPNIISVEESSANSKYVRGELLIVNEKFKLIMEPLSSVVLNVREYLSR